MEKLIIENTLLKKELEELKSKLEKYKTTTYIYLLTNKETGEKYIGQSVDVNKRFYSHLTEGYYFIKHEPNKKIKNVIDEYKKIKPNLEITTPKEFYETLKNNYKIDVLDWIETYKFDKTKVNKLEQKYIKEMKANLNTVISKD